MTQTQTAPQETRLAELKDELRVHDEATESARLAYIEAVHDNLPTDEIKQRRRRWDNARAGRNAHEALILTQEV